MKTSKKMFLVFLWVTFFSPMNALETASGVLIEEAPGSRAPELQENLDWLNTDHPLRLKDFQGKFILLDFWTYCCINCIHLIPELKALEEKYPEELVVIGIHSAKFSTEQGTENIREAILRYGIEHPVVNDRQLSIWKTYGVHAWPTVVLIDPEGHIIGKKSGEGIFEPIDQVLTRAIKKFSGTLDRRSLSFALEKDKKKESLLDFPGKILADPSSNRLFIADSGHNQILEADLNGQILNSIGTGEPGQMDGAFYEAQFNQPFGMALDRQFLYVADSNNHLIRQVDLEKKIVNTVAGIGIQGKSKDPKGKDAKRIALNSPGDLWIVGNRLYIAMTGAHQIWAMDLPEGTLHWHAGSGIENLKDDLNRLASLAQPSGLASDGQKLFFADSEISAIRFSQFEKKGEVHTIIGTGLFDFGDEDGDVSTARLQHPLGLTFANQLLYVADTYNNKIKVIDLENQSVRTLAGSKAGYLDGKLAESRFNEPSGITFLNDQLFIADTNNHQIRRIDLKSGTVSTFVLKIPETAPNSLEKFSAHDFSGDWIVLKESFSNFIQDIKINLELPLEHKFLKTAPSRLSLYTQEGDFVADYTIEELVQTFVLKKEINSNGLYAEVILYYCREGQEALCLIRDILFEIPLKKETVPSTIELKHTIPSNPKG